MEPAILGAFIAAAFVLSACGGEKTISSGDDLDVNVKVADQPSN